MNNRNVAPISVRRIDDFCLMLHEMEVQGCVTNTTTPPIGWVYSEAVRYWSLQRFPPQTHFVLAFLAIFTNSSAEIRDSGPKIGAALGALIVVGWHVLIALVSDNICPLNLK